MIFATYESHTNMLLKISNKTYFKRCIRMFVIGHDVNGRCTFAYVQAT